MSFEFNEEKHEYTLDGERLPSVTEILSPLQAESFAAINPAVLQAAADRGTAVHEITEAMDYDLDYEDLIAPDLVPFADAYEEFLMDHEVEWQGIEMPVHFFEQYAGTVDRFGYIDGTPAVLDIKTVQSPSVEQKVSVCCQLYAYDRAIKACFPEFQGKHLAHLALYLKKDGSYKLFDCREFAAKDDLDPSAIWTDLWNIYEFKQLAISKLNAIKDKHRRKK